MWRWSTIWYYTVQAKARGGAELGRALTSAVKLPTVQVRALAEKAPLCKYFSSCTVCSFLLNSSLGHSFKRKSVTQFWRSFGAFLDCLQAMLLFRSCIRSHWLHTSCSWWPEASYSTYFQANFGCSHYPGNGLLHGGGFGLWRAVGCIWMLITCSIKFEGKCWRAKNVDGSAMFFSCCRIDRGEELRLYGSG